MRLDFGLRPKQNVDFDLRCSCLFSLIDTFDKVLNREKRDDDDEHNVFADY